jgi:hypothetical protein
MPTLRSSSSDMWLTNNAWTLSANVGYLRCVCVSVYVCVCGTEVGKGEPWHAHVLVVEAGVA